ncbi:GH36-type glycosyl hydrolase domain-containing protein [Alkaliphilus serpentinus]|nr:glucoamylase family protein [Alkaliphilus serpentinus]
MKDYYNVKRDKIAYMKDILLNIEDLGDHGREIAKEHTVVRGKRTKKLTFRLDYNFKEIVEVYLSLSDKSKNRREISPPAEWLLDNFYKIEEQVKEIKQALMAERYSRFDLLDNGLLKGYPRVYVIAMEMVSHTDGRIDEDTIKHFIRAYQSKAVLATKEIWSISLMIKLALIENIRVICERIRATEGEWLKAEGAINHKSHQLLELVKENFENHQGVNSSYIEHLLKRLRREGIESGEIIGYIEKRLMDYDISISQLIEEEHRSQAGRKISIGNAITSLNAIASIDWNDIFESLSIVEEILRKDPLEVYKTMDFESRDYYRRQIDIIAKKNHLSERRVAKAALELAEGSHKKGLKDKTSHVGYYIVDKGRKQLMSQLGLSKDQVRPKRLSHYFLSIAIIAAIVILVSLLQLPPSEALSLYILTIILLMIPASSIAVILTNWRYMTTVPPVFMPRIEFKEGIPRKAATMVVVPTLLTSPQRAKELTEMLEVYYLANKEENLYFALVGDFKDGDYEDSPEDEEILNTAIDGIKALNHKYSKDVELFHYFHRKRQLSKTQKKWMGWERKRGALVELNQLLKGSKSTSYQTITGNLGNFAELKYIITIDADTILPIDAAKSLIGIMSHPLNHPVVDMERGIVTEGYGLIQPRIKEDFESANKSAFTKIFAGDGGIDPYTTVFSDVYQDLFGEGIFTGKGIYHLELFNRLLTDAIPDHTVLSHDLLEGSYLRTGLATDVELIDGFPAKYSSYIKRLHRWVRGDWQLIRWLPSRIQNRRGKTIDNPLSRLSKWKIIDNLRRSLVSVSLTVLIVAAALILPGSFLWWLAITLFTLSLPLLTGGINQMRGMIHSTDGVGNGLLATGLGKNLKYVVLTFVFLPFEAYVMMDAIIKALFRMFISKEKLLEWVPIADVESKQKGDFESFIYQMKSAPVISIALLLAVVLYRPQHLAYIIPICALWLVSPWIAYYISREETIKPEELLPHEEKVLRRIARKTWGYFEDLANEENNYLPPDNLQIEPENGVAHRTSPTNIGFYLLAIVTARDFGYITTSKMVADIKECITTIERMETWKGHLFNWYDTRSLRVLKPSYVSTVDSGNFITYLITLSSSLEDILNSPLINPKLLEGLLDTMEEEEENHPYRKRIEEALKDKLTLNKWLQLVEELSEYQEKIDKKSHKTRGHIEGIKNDLEYYLPSKNYLDIIEFQIKDKEAQKLLDATASLMELEGIYLSSIKEIEAFDKVDPKLELQIKLLKAELINLLGRVEGFKLEAMGLKDKIDKLVGQVEFTHLYDSKRNLFSIGYNGEEERLTNSYYDLLASEVRATSYLAIARKEVPKKHWFRMGRRLARINGNKSLISWTGTMFEYFMPYLIMKEYRGTLWSETYKAVLKAQKKFGEIRRAPWGVSESGYYAFDLQLNYQYQAFGIPDLGLKRGLADYTVISPYSTLLALPYQPKEAFRNVTRLIEEGLEGQYGFYEAVDYSPIMVKGKGREIIRSFMAHHQGMIFVSLNNYFHHQIMQRRFHSQPLIKAVEQLLQEKLPTRAIIANEYISRTAPIRDNDCNFERSYRVLGEPEEYPPKCHLLSNGSYSLMITSGGTGYSKKGEMQITRWREDPIQDQYGNFIFFRNTITNDTWSGTYEPLYDKPDGYKVIFSPDKAEFLCRNDVIDTHTEVIVSPEDNVEIRKTTLTNHSNQPIIIEATSYQEVILNAAAADMAHPAFSNLFVITEALPEYEALLASRRRREERDRERWLFHTVVIKGETVGGTQYETNRGNFIGRGRDISNPAAITQPLTNSVGIAIDPIVSIRRTVKIDGGKSVEISYITGIEDTKKAAIDLVRKYSDSSAIERSFQLAHTRSQVEAAYLNLKSGEITLYEDMLSHIIYISPLKEKYHEVIMKNSKGQSALWPYGISGDLPIILMTIGKASEIDLVEEALKAHEYFKTKGLRVDLVILNEDESNYLQSLQRMLTDLVISSQGSHLLDQPGGVFIRNTSMMPKEDIYLFYSAARMVLKGDGGPISRQMVATDVRELPPEKDFNEAFVQYPIQEEPLEVDFFNGYGGFSKDGKEYIIKLKENINTPAPWTNVIANETFGFLATESGAGAIWAENSRENKLAPWSNDPVSNPPSEVLYIRDDDTGSFWTITPLPIREKECYMIHHGGGYTTYNHNSQGIKQRLTMFTPVSEAVKLNWVTLKNTSNKPRNLTLMYYMRPVLGVNEDLTQQYIKTWKMEGGGIGAQNPYSTDFGDRVVFVNTTEAIASYTCDRREFIGIGGGLSHPRALKAVGLSNTSGSSLNPCIAMETRLQLKEGEERELAFFIGQDQSEEGCIRLMNKYRNIENIKEEFNNVKEFWHKTLSKIEVKTPDLSMDLMLNQWLLYQTISCRLWARTAFYQSGGAYGFRDQLQDVMSIIHLLPEVVKKQIILHSEHQFLEGDVQHWWHPGGGEKGIRTRFSDDLLWLPYVTAEYIEKTQDFEILQEESHFLEDVPLSEDEDERYGVPKISNERANIYQHCIRAIERGLKFGEHDIPLMGSGDWNDGMSTVGNKGRGESVWLGWFLYAILKRFTAITEAMGDTERTQRYDKIADDIAKAIEKNAWDGNWYIRAFYDDGSPLGSSKNTECIIDSLGQSWSIISGGGSNERIMQAMKSVEDYLIRREEGLILLFTPPFDKSDQNPGYIKGYVPGVRENGGQYSHAAAWVIKAFALMGEGDKAWQLYNMINPINHCRTQLEASTYKVEPYVMAADVYAVAPHVGRGGWTWYTGVAGWMYTIGIQHILGLKIEGDNLTLDPCIPKDWSSYSIKYSYMDATYNITIKNPKGVHKGVERIILDGKAMNSNFIKLENKDKEHIVEVFLG